MRTGEVPRPKGGPGEFSCLSICISKFRGTALTNMLGPLIHLSKSSWQTSNFTSSVLEGDVSSKSASFGTYYQVCYCYLPPMRKLFFLLRQFMTSFFFSARSKNQILNFKLVNIPLGFPISYLIGTRCKIFQDESFSLQNTSTKRRHFLTQHWICTDVNMAARVVFPLPIFTGNFQF